jgi:hypothetical protein
LISSQGKVKRLQARRVASKRLLVLGGVPEQHRSEDPLGGFLLGHGGGVGAIVGFV